MGEETRSASSPSCPGVTFAVDAPVDKPVMKRSPLLAPGRGPKRSVTIEGRITQDLQEADPSKDHLYQQLRHPAQDAIEKLQPGKLVSIWGRRLSEKDVFQPFFSQHPMNFGDSERGSRLQHRVGVLCQRGFKPDQPNQDDCLVLDSADWMLFGVFDGHGAEGHHVSHFVQEHLPKYMMESLIKKQQEWAEASRESFLAMDYELKRELREQSYSSGTTVSLAVLSSGPDLGGVDSLRLRVAHVGDSSIIHGVKPAGTSSWEASVLTDPHKPDRPDEAHRINAMGGEILLSNDPGVSARLRSDDFDIAMSRSMGDFEAISSGLISEPEVGREVILKESDEHIILACSDGVWDVMSPAQACQIVAKFKPDDAQKAAEKLVQKAQVRWQEMTGDCVDDITVILIRPIFGRGTYAEEDSVEETSP